MRIVTLTTLFFTVGFMASSSSASKIYQWTDANGNVVFGDKPVDKQQAQEVEISPMMIIPAFETQEQKEARLKKEAEQRALAKQVEEEEANTEEEEFKYESFSITSIEDGSAIRANGGMLPITFEIKPELGPNDSITVYLDGKKHVEDSKSLSTNLVDLNRGEHSLFAVIKNEAGSVLLNSNTVRFHILRHSRLFEKQNQQF